MSVLKAYNIDTRIVGEFGAQVVEAINEYMFPFIQKIDSNITFSPGNTSPTSSGHSFILYDFIPSVNFQLFMLHTDTIIYKLSDINFEKVSRIAQTFLTKLNLEFFQGTILEPGFKIMHCDANGAAGRKLGFKNTDSEFVDDFTELFTMTVEVHVIYTVKYEV